MRCAPPSATSARSGELMRNVLRAARLEKIKARDLSLEDFTTALRALYAFVVEVRSMSFRRAECQRSIGPNSLGARRSA